MLKKLGLCFGVLFAVMANAELASHANLVGQRMNAATGGSTLVCEYSGRRVHYEILARHGSCARFIEVR